MGKYVFRTKDSNIEVVWENGSIKAPARMARILKEQNEIIKGSGKAPTLTGANFVYLPSADYLKTPLGCYLLLNCIEPTEVIEGDLSEQIQRLFDGQDR